jgi:hypothetical protein
MTKKQLIKELDKISKCLNGIGGRLVAASLNGTAVRDAHEMTIRLGIKVDDLINELMEDGVAADD